MSPQPIISPKVYLLVWGGLLVLLCATWSLAQLDLRPFNALIALAIALLKMMLIVLFFMHLRFSSRLTWLFVSAGFVWLGFLIALTLSDYLTRG